jgi:hypothetical protein
MATPMTAAKFIELCDQWGVKHIPIRPDWATHNRNHKGDWGPVNGIGIHHTGSDGGVNDQENVLWNGYGDLPGPLCHSGIDPAGILRLAGWGRTNHFGLGSATTLNHVIAEDYDGTKNLKPGPATIDGNSHFYGFEIMYSGKHAMSDAQRKTIVRVCAAICTYHKWTELSAIGHGEWQQGKWDPGIRSGVMMPVGSLRAEIHQAIKEGPKASKKIHTVAAGDTLYSIAKKYDITVEVLIKANPQLVKPGDKLVIPKG